MKAGILIEKLQKLVNEHGNLEVGHFVDEFCSFACVTKVWTKESVQSDVWYESDDEQLIGKFIALNGI